MALSASEDSLFTALQNYLAAVTAQKSASPPDLRPHCLLLDKLSRELSPLVHPQLQHFLHSKSYRKAHDYLFSSVLAKTQSSAQT